MRTTSRCRPRLQDADLSDAERADIESLVEIADLLWLANQRPPSLEEDPVAIRLGIVPNPRHDS